VISEQNRAEFEQRGPDGVHKQIQFALYSGEKLQQAYEWLDAVEHGADRALSRTQVAIASDARNAAWAAARAAERANTRATIALIIATISALATIASIIVPLFLKRG
jgi:hypothetical protein